MLLTNDTRQERFDYCPQLFETEDLVGAKTIILTPQSGTSTEERWEKETPYLVEQIGQFLKPDHNTCILDYGCGIGRIAKSIIERFNCWVLGVDISLSMRRFAPDYVQSERFAICSPQTLNMMVEKGFCADHAISIWVLQHCAKPVADIFQIKAALKSKGLFYVVNNINRAVPSKNGWIDDGINIKNLLYRQFIEVFTSALPLVVTTSQISQNTFINVLQKI